MMSYLRPVRPGTRTTPGAASAVEKLNGQPSTPEAPNPPVREIETTSFVLGGGVVGAPEVEDPYDYDEYA